MKTLVLSAGALLFLSAATSVLAENNWQFRQVGSRDPSIAFKGSPISVGGSFVCVAPDWNARYFWLVSSPFRQRSSPSQLLITSDPEKPSDFFVDQLRFEAIGPTSMRIAVDGKFTRNHPAIIEYIPLALPADLMKGARIEDEKGTSVTVGSDKCEIDRESTRLVITTRFGTITLTTNDEPGLTLVDRRDHPYKGKEVFLIFVAREQGIAPGERFRHEMVLTVSEDFTGYAAVPILPALIPKGGPIVPLPSVRLAPPAMSTDLFPKPKVLTHTDGRITLPRALGLTADPSLEAGRLAKLLNELLTVAGISCEAREEPRGFITVRKIAPPSSEQYDYYEIAIAADGITIGSVTPRGAYYALCTLVQSADSSGVLLTGAVKDWADFPFRGIHILADDTTLRLDGAFIKNVFGPLKINQIILECEYVKWPSHPEMHTPWGMTTEDVAAFLRTADDHYIEVSPLLQTYGHCEYLFAGGDNLDIAENPDRPYAYDVSNPRTYQVIGDLLNDVRKAFPVAPYLHIGHDEVTHFGNYPARPENVGQSLAALLWKDLQFYQDYAAKEHLKLMLWQDYLNGRSQPAHREELFSVAKKLDKSAVIAVWDYSPSTRFPEIKPFMELGFTVIGATGEEDVANVVNFSRYAKKQGVFGMMHTTWTGHGGNAAALFKYTRKLWMYVQAGVSFWNAQSPVVDCHAPSRATGMFNRVIAAMYPRRYFFGADTATPIDLSAIADASLAERGGFEAGMLRTPTGMAFSLPAYQESAACLTVHEDTPLTIPIGRKARAVSFLFAVLDNDPAMKPAGSITIHGEQDIVQPLIVRREIGNIIEKLLIPGGEESGRILTKNDPQEIFAVAQPVFSAGGRYVLWQFDLATGNQRVHSITLRAAHQTSIVLAGITVVE
ncbi:MAG: glycoside hydrolase family 20 zincin-like fold domain-containing protein [Phycisphaerales bacterium]